MEALFASCNVAPAPTTMVPPVRTAPERFVRDPPTKLSVWPCCAKTTPLLVSVVANTPKPLTVPLLARLAGAKVPPPRTRLPALDMATLEDQFRPPSRFRAPAAVMVANDTSMATSVPDVVLNPCIAELVPLKVTVASSVTMIVFCGSSSVAPASASKAPPVRVVPETLLSAPATVSVPALASSVPELLIAPVIVIRLAPWSRPSRCW